MRVLNGTLLSSTCCMGRDHWTKQTDYERDWIQVCEQKWWQLHYEYHVNDLSQEMINEILANLPFGGKLSLWKKQEEKPNIHQYIFTSHCWYGPKGEMAIILKDEGYGIMISEFQSQEFGFGMHLSEDELKMVNELQREQWPNYASEESAMKCWGNTGKEELKISPF